MYENESKMHILQALGFSFFNYCHVVWHFVGMEDNKKIEQVRIRYRALEFVFNNSFKSPYSILREQFGLSLLYMQHIRFLLMELYKMYNLLRPIYLHDVLCRQANRMSTRNINNLR